MRIAGLLDHQRQDAFLHRFALRLRCWRGVAGCGRNHLDLRFDL